MSFKVMARLTVKTTYKTSEKTCKNNHIKKEDTSLQLQN